MTMQPQSFDSFLSSQWGLCYPSLIATMLTFYLAFLIFKNPGIVDFAWSLCHLQLGLIVFLNNEGYNYQPSIVFLALLGLWFLRLGGFMLVTRIIPGEKDPRYEKLAKKRGKRPLLYFFINYQLQAFLVSICSIPLYFVFSKEQSNEYTWSMIIGIIFIIIGLIGEAVADQQLYDYKERQKHAGKLTHKDSNQSQEGEQIKGIFAEGLWAKSRHPNLFFEQMIWIGFAFGGLDGWLSIIGFTGPIILHLIMRYLTVPLTENHMKDSRKDVYEHFCKRTNMFFII